MTLLKDNSQTNKKLDYENKQITEKFWNSVSDENFKEYLIKQNKLTILHINQDFNKSNKFVITIEPDNIVNSQLKYCNNSNLPGIISFEENNVKFTKYSITSKSKKLVNNILITKLTSLSTDNQLFHIRFFYNCDCKNYCRNYDQVRYSNIPEKEMLDCHKCRNKFLKKEFKILDFDINNQICLITNPKNNIIKSPIYFCRSKYFIANFEENLCNICDILYVPCTF